MFAFHGHKTPSDHSLPNPKAGRPVGESRGAKTPRVAELRRTCAHLDCLASVVPGARAGPIRASYHHPQGELNRFMPPRSHPRGLGRTQRAAPKHQQPSEHADYIRWRRLLLLLPPPICTPPGAGYVIGRSVNPIGRIQSISRPADSQHDASIHSTFNSAWSESTPFPIIHTGLGASLAPFSLHCSHDAAGDARSSASSSSGSWSSGNGVDTC